MPSTLLPSNLQYVHNQTSASSAWTVNHQLNCLVPHFDVILNINTWKEKAYPASVEYVDENTMIIRWSAARSGHVVLVNSQIGAVTTTAPTATPNQQIQLLLHGTSITDVSYWNRSAIYSADISGISADVEIDASTSPGSGISSSIHFKHTVGNHISYNGNSPGGAIGFNCGDNDFTIEFWVKRAETCSRFGSIFSTPANAWGSGIRGVTAFMPGADSSMVRKIALYNSDLTGVKSGVFTSIIADDVWTHVAFVRIGDTITAYTNGQSTDTMQAWSQYSYAPWNFASSSGYINFGFAQFDGANGYFRGHIAEFRFTNGQGRYNGNFTPSTNPLLNSD